MTVETLNIVSIDSAFSDPNGAVTDIDEPVASADGNSYGTTTENDTADFGLTNPALISDADTVNSVTITLRAKKGGTAGNERFQVDLLIGGVVQGSQQTTGNLTTSFANYTGINDAGWNSDWTLAQLQGMQFRLTAIQAGMGGTQVTDLDCADVDVDFTEAAAGFAPEADAFSFFEDGTESGAALVYVSANENSNIWRNHTITADKPFHLRWRAQETAGGAGLSTDDWGMEIELNESATWNTFDASSSYAQAAAGSATDGEATTDRLGAGGGSYVAGALDEVNGSIENIQLTANNYNNLVFSGTLVEGNLSSGDRIRFRLTLNGTPITNSVTPTIQVTTGPVLRDWKWSYDGTPDDIVEATHPTSVVEGDFQVVMAQLDNQTTGSFDTISGWTDEYDDLSQAILTGVFSRIAPASPPATTSFTTTGASSPVEDSVAFSFRFDGHDPDTPIDVKSNANGSSDTPTSTGVTTTGLNEFLLNLVSFDGNDFTENIGPPTGTMEHIKGGERWNGSGGSSGGFFAGGIKTTAGGTGDATWPSTTVTDGWHAYQIAIQPPPAVGNNAPLFMHHFKQMANN